jgi:hypothetical protein
MQASLVVGHAPGMTALSRPPPLELALPPKPPLPRPRLALIAPPHHRSDLLTDGNPQLRLLQHPDFIAQSPGFLELQFA